MNLVDVCALKSGENSSQIRHDILANLNVCGGLNFSAINLNGSRYSPPTLFGQPLHVAPAAHPRSWVARKPSHAAHVNQAVYPSSCRRMLTRLPGVQELQTGMVLGHQSGMGATPGGSRCRRWAGVRWTHSGCGKSAIDMNRGYVKIMTLDAYRAPIIRADDR